MKRSINKPDRRHGRQKKAATGATGVDRQFGQALETFTPQSNAGARPYDGEIPEFGSVSDVERIFGFGRTSTYALIAEGKIRSAAVRIRGKHSGKRLIHLPSVLEYIASQMKVCCRENG